MPLSVLSLQNCPRASPCWSVVTMFTLWPARTIAEPFRKTGFHRACPVFENIDEDRLSSRLGTGLLTTEKTTDRMHNQVHILQAQVFSDREAQYLCILTQCNHGFCTLTRYAYAASFGKAMG